MDNLKAKIEKTSLFSPEAKVHLLAHFSELPPEEQQKLETTIDTFEARGAELAIKLRKDVTEQIDALKAEAAPEEQKDVDDASNVLKIGLDVLVGSSPQSS